MNICTALERQTDFKGLAGFSSVCFVLFFGDRFLDGSWNGFLMIFTWIWGLFWLPKSIKHRIDFGIYFWFEGTHRQSRPPQDWIPIPEGNRNGGTEELCSGSDTPWDCGPANFHMFFIDFGMWHSKEFY